jgi:hypothetical protein
MDIRKMDALSDWDDWSDDGPEWWLRHPLHRPRARHEAPVRRAVSKNYPQTARKRTTA